MQICIVLPATGSCPVNSDKNRTVAGTVIYLTYMNMDIDNKIYTTYKTIKNHMTVIDRLYIKLPDFAKGRSKKDFYTYFFNDLPGIARSFKETVDKLDRLPDNLLGAL